MKKLALIVLCMLVQCQVAQGRMLPSPTGTYPNGVVNKTGQCISFVLTHGCSPKEVSGKAVTSVQPGQTAYYELSEGRSEGHFLYITRPCGHSPVCHEVFLGNIVHVYPDRIETQMQ